MSRYIVLLITFLMLINSNLIAAEVVEIKLPGDTQIKFQPVFLGLDGNKVFSSKRVKLGSREGGDLSYKERLSTTNLGGSFVAANKRGEKEWLYYLGQTEISVKQWNSVMRWWQQENGLQVDPSDDSLLPQTGKTPSEIFTFIEALNVWMLKNDRNSLPKHGNAIAYARLPTEVEWAFAARGGNEVSPSVFDRPYPYVDESGSMTLAGYEWHRSSSGKKLKQTGSEYLKPNPLGLYDMLGNAEEFTYGIFGHDFLFARFGGLVIRGGNYSTDPRHMNVSRRTEYNGFTRNGELIRLSKVGFRLALSTLVSETGHTNDELDEGYEDYLRSDTGVTQTATAGSTSLSQQALEDQVNHTRLEKERLAEANSTLQSENSRLKSDYTLLQGNLEQSRVDVEALSKELNAAKAKNLELALLPSAGSVEAKFTLLLDSKDSEISRLQAQIAQLNSRVKSQAAKLTNAEAANQQILSLQQRVNDAERRDNSADFEIDKNRKRIITVEKRLLESLTRVAGYNLFTAWRNLRSIEIKKKIGSNPQDWAINQREAENMLKEYRRYVIQIVDDTDYNLFPEVKNELIRWLNANQVSPQQVKGLNLLERHIQQVKDGKYLQVDYLYENLLLEIEME
ncbi:SUMF1/EgtB/PvdO family nonheme iron enzyme [Vibrio sp. WXL103]|uniref:formylglycine-generating enzyme family protein n=1 Tax=Vibrio sp. WXL103 TaxID=3450710 RepID=UPI003EC66A13